MVCFEPVNAHIQYRGGGRDRERVNDSKHWDPLGVGNSDLRSGRFAFRLDGLARLRPFGDAPLRGPRLTIMPLTQLEIVPNGDKWQVWNSERPGGVTTWPRSFSETPHGRTGPTIARVLAVIARDTTKQRVRFLDGPGRRETAIGRCVTATPPRPLASRPARLGS